MLLSQPAAWGDAGMPPKKAVKHTGIAAAYRRGHRSHGLTIA